jgi:hypothetical protein
MGLAVACRQQLSGCIPDCRAGSVQAVGALLLLLAVGLQAVSLCAEHLD